MGKVFAVFDEEEQLLLKRIYFDEDPQDALQFVLEHIIPKVGKEISCISATLSGKKDGWGY
ncbi:MAG TPA: hypothetical protein VN611_10335 [Patescibacteria group bacterium]|nr:hypothetical protein [Patescibacteria group bacterium]